MEKMEKWNAKLNVGFSMIDKQHKIIFELINDFGRISETKADKQVIDNLLNVIEDYFFRHFQTEEKVFKNHPEATGHSLKHYALIKSLHNFRTNLRNKKTGEKTIHEFLSSWFVNHIETSDMPLFRNMLMKGEITEAKTIIENNPIKQIDRRRHKRFPWKIITHTKVVASCYNPFTLRKTTAIVADVSSGGMKIESINSHAVGELLKISCSIGRNFKMEEKVRVVNALQKSYGVEFINPSPGTKHFLTELHGAIRGGEKESINIVN